MSMFGGWIASSSSKEDAYLTRMADAAIEHKQFHELHSQRQRSRSRSRSPSRAPSPSHSDYERDIEIEDDYISVTSSVRSEERRRRKRNRSPSPRSQQPVPPPAPARPQQQRVEINSTHDNAGLFNAGPYAGLPSGAMPAALNGGMQIPQEEPKQIAFDPFEEDFSEAIKKDKETPDMDPSYCFLCIYSQTAQDRDRNPHYMSLLKIWYESYGKCSLLHLCTKVQEKYNDRIRKRNPLKYKPYSLVTIRDHFMGHIKSQEMFHVESIRFMDKIRTVLEKKVFTYPENNPSDTNIDSKQLSAWYKVHGQLAAAYSTLANKRSRASKALA